MTPELCKNYIKQMLSCIDNECDLKQIYTIVRRKFINRYPQLETEWEERDDIQRENIDKILDKLNDEELRSVWLFLVGRTGYSGMGCDDQC